MTTHDFYQALDALLDASTDEAQRQAEEALLVLVRQHRESGHSPEPHCTTSGLAMIYHWAVVGYAGSLLESGTRNMQARPRDSQAYQWALAGLKKWGAKLRAERARA